VFLKTIWIVRPGDAEASELLRRYADHLKLGAAVPARAGWEFDRIVVLVNLVLQICCTDHKPLWASVPVMTGLTLYAGWTFIRPPKVVRQYRRYLRQGRIIEVPELAVRVGNEAVRAHPGLQDWEEFPQRYFELLKEARRLPELVELQNDCGCNGLLEQCGHPNRLKQSSRKRLRRSVREYLEERVTGMAEAHVLALGARDLRNATIEQVYRTSQDEDD
jgi:hypothetical protein